MTLGEAQKIPFEPTVSYMCFCAILTLLSVLVLAMSLL